jgi:hypothetical protein
MSRPPNLDLQCLRIGRLPHDRLQVLQLVDWAGVEGSGLCTHALRTRRRGTHRATTRNALQSGAHSQRIRRCDGRMHVPVDRRRGAGEGRNYLCQVPTIRLARHPCPAAPGRSPPSQPVTSRRRLLPSQGTANRPSQRSHPPGGSRARRSGFRMAGRRWNLPSHSPSASPVGRVSWASCLGRHTHHSLLRTGRFPLSHSLLASIPLGHRPHLPSPSHPASTRMGHQVHPRSHSPPANTPTASRPRPRSPGSPHQVGHQFRRRCPAWPHRLLWRRPRPGNRGACCGSHLECRQH